MWYLQKKWALWIFSLKKNYLQTDQREFALARKYSNSSFEKYPVSINFLFKIQQKDMFEAKCWNN